MQGRARALQARSNRGGRAESARSGLLAANEAGAKAPARRSGTLDRKPLITDAAAVKMARQMRFNPLRNLSPQMLMTALDSFENGYLRDAAVLWAKILQRDDLLAVVAPKREAAVTRRQWEVLTTGDESRAKEADAQKTALEYFWNNATAVNAFDRNERGRTRQIFAQFHRAISFRYSAQHIVWKPSPQGLTAEFEFVPLEYFENLTGELRWLGPTGFRAEGEPLDPQNWIIACGAGLMQACSAPYGFKSLSLMDWVSYNEKFGLPFPIGKTNAPKDSPEWDAMVEAVEGIINDGGAVMSKDADIDTLEVKSSGEPFAALIERCDRAMSAIYIGSDLSTLSRGGAGNSGASVQGGEALKFESDDCAWLSEQLQRIDQLVLEYTFGRGVEVLAYTHVRGPNTRDLRGDLEIDRQLIEWKLPISKQDLAERYQRTMAEPGEEIAGEAAPAPTPTPAPVPTPAPLLGTNERTAQDDEALAAALRNDLAPLRARLAEVLQAGDAGLQEALQKFDTSTPDILEEVMQGSSMESAVQAVLGKEFLAGLGHAVTFTDEDEVAGNAYNPKQARVPKGQKGGGQFATKDASSIQDVLRHAPEHEKGEWEHTFKVKPSNRVRQITRQKTGIDLVEAKHIFGTKEARHILRNHSNPTELGQREWAMLPEVIANADMICTSKTNSGQDAVEFWKEDGSYLLVVETYTKRGDTFRVHNYKRLKAGPKERGAAPLT